MKWDEFTAGWLAHALQTFPQDSPLSFHMEEKNVLQNNLQANVKNLHNAHAMFSLLNVLLMLAVQPMCLSSGFSFSCASCHELSLFCVYCRAFLWSICSSCAGSQHNTGMPVCPSTQSIPKALNFSSLPMEWVGFADTDTEGLCPPSPSYSWAVFLWWCSHGATALPCYCRICKTALLCLIHNLPLIIPLFFPGYKPSIWQH